MYIEGIEERSFHVNQEMVMYFSVVSIVFITGSDRVLIMSVQLPILAFMSCKKPFLIKTEYLWHANYPAVKS